MILTQLVDLKTRLENFSTSELVRTAEHNRTEVFSWQNLATNDNIKHNLDFLIRTFDSITANSLSTEIIFKNLLDQVNKEIDNQSAKFLTYGYHINNSPALVPSQNTEIDRNFRTIPRTKEFEEELGSRIRQFTNWKYPTLEIGPGLGAWTDNLVGSEPLYLVDIHREYLNATTYKYQELFKRRIRSYLIGAEAEKSHLDLSDLPENQVGFIFSWAVFDFLPLDHLTTYLRSCFKVLRPGGIMLFSYNDCDNYQNAALAENAQRHWMTKKLLKQVFDMLGFELLSFCVSQDQQHSWVEIKKPGQLKSIKSHTPMAKVMARPGAPKVDNTVPRNYNEQQIARLKQIAIKMALGNDEEIMAGKYKPHELDQMINVARMNK